MRITFCLTLCALCLLPPSRGRAQLLSKSVPVDGYAAMVNDRVITVSDVMALVQPVERQLKATYDGDELEQKMLEAYQEARDTLVARALILEEFRKQGGALPEHAVDDRLDELIRERFNNDRAAFLEALAEERITPAEWRDQVRDRIIISLMRNQEVTRRVAVSPSQVRKLYEERKDDYQVPEKVKLRMITLNKGASEEDQAVKRKQAEEVLARLNKGDADFAALAREVSDGNKAARGGDWGWIDPAILRPEIAREVKTLDAGEHSGLIETDDQFYIVAVEARQNPSVVPFEEVRGELEDELRQKESKRLYDEWIDRLKHKHFVRLF